MKTKELFPGTEFVQMCTDLVFCGKPAVEVAVVNRDQEVPMCAEHYDNHAAYEGKYLRVK